MASRVGCLPGQRGTAPLQNIDGSMHGPCETSETGETLDNPSMVSVLHDICTSLYKIGNVGHQQRELRFPLGILHCHYLPPAV